jgi:hypothetical protein
VIRCPRLSLNLLSATGAEGLSGNLTAFLHASNEQQELVGKTRKTRTRPTLQILQNLHLPSLNNDDLMRV